MVDIENRNELKFVLNEYINERITAFEFDDCLSRIQGRTHDNSVLQMTQQLWFCYSGVEDHKIHANKIQWDWFQRILLFLETENEIENEILINNYKISHWSQIVAFLTLVFGIFLEKMTDADWLVSVAFPIALTLFLFRKYRCFQFQKKHQSISNINKLTPFGSVLSLFKARKKSRYFSKKKYPEHLKNREFPNEKPIKNYDNEATFLVMLFFGPIVYIVLSVLSPVFLFFFCFPIRYTEVASPWQ